MFIETELKKLKEMTHSKTRDVTTRRIAVNMVLNHNYTIKTTAKMVMASKNAVTSWVAAFKKHGLAGLEEEDRSGRPPLVERKRLEELVGNDKTVNLHKFVDMINKETGVQYSMEHARRLLRNMGFALKKRRVIAAGAPAREEVEKWQKDTEIEIKTLVKKGYAVFMMDEAHQRTSIYGTGAEYTRGEPEAMTAPVPGVKVSMFGAVSLNRETYYMSSEKANSDSLIRFIQMLERIERKKPIALIMDNAAYHKSKKVRDYVESRGGRVKLIFLLPYTPFLNPAENLWRRGKALMRRARRAPPPSRARWHILALYRTIIIEFNPLNILLRRLDSLYPP